LHWPYDTDFSGLSTYGLNSHGKGDEHSTYASYWGMVRFTLLLESPVTASLGSTMLVIMMI